MGLFSFLGFGDKSPKSNKVNTINLDTISYDELYQLASDYLNVQLEICKEAYKISTYENWFYDQLTGELTFSNSGIKKLIIDYEEVGSVSEVSNTFLWAWDNPHILDKVKSEITKVRDYGIKRDFEKLFTPKWEGDQYDGWEMTAIACYLLQAKGAYRVPLNDDTLFSFMIFKNIRWADNKHLN